MKEKRVEYPGLVAVMASRGDTHASLADVLDISTSAVSRRISGEVEWSLGEIRTICNHYKKSYYELFDEGGCQGSR